MNEQQTDTWLQWHYIFAFIAVISFIFIIGTLLYTQFRTPDEDREELVQDEDYYTPVKERPGWHTIQLGFFQIDTPEDYVYLKYSDERAFIGKITNQKDTFSFYLGQQALGIDNVKWDASQVSTDTINGYKAKVIIPTTGNGPCSVYIDELPDDQKFNIQSLGKEQKSQALKIFRTIRFPSSDTGLNSITFGENFQALPPDGNQIFNGKCIFCHSQKPDEIIAGPSLHQVFKKQDEQYILAWVTQSRTLIREGLSRAQRIDSLFEGNCAEYPSFELAEIKAIESYLQEQK